MQIRRAFLAKVDVRKFVQVEVLTIWLPFKNSVDVHISMDRSKFKYEEVVVSIPLFLHSIYPSYYFHILENIVNYLEENLKLITEIDGYLKVVRSYPLISLSFFKNLKVIHGNVLENGR